MLTDPEGAPVAALEVTDVWPTSERLLRRRRHGAPDGRRRARAVPAAAAYARRRSGRCCRPGRVLGVIADRPLHRPQLAQIAHAARTLAAHLLILIPVSGPGPDGLPPEALVRAIFAARDRMPPATIVAVPLLPRGDEMRDALLRARVAAAYGVTHVLSTGEMLSGGGLRVLVPRELAYDNRDGQWRWRDDIPPRNRRLAMTPAEIDDLLDRGFPLPEWHTPPAVAKELARVRPPRRHRGLVVFFTGFSGSGKSTIARGLADSLRESGERTITLLDGDVVRRELSAGLGFSKADRDRNVRRIGWVAAEVARHRGHGDRLPDRAVRRAPGRPSARWPPRPAPASCWCTWPPRSRSASSATARACTPGPAPVSCAGMTGIDDPYEEPTDAELTLDTTDHDRARGDRRRAGLPGGERLGGAQTEVSPSRRRE